MKSGKFKSKLPDFLIERGIHPNDEFKVIRTYPILIIEVNNIRYITREKDIIKWIKLSV